VSADAPSREAVLAAIRRAALAPTEAPEPWVSSAASDRAPSERFAEALEVAGGSARLMAPADLPSALAEHADALGATTIHSTHPGLASRYPGAAPDSPHDLADLDLAVAAGAPAVAESGAVWLTPADALARAALFLAEHVALVVSETEIVPDLHQAYARVDPGATPFGCFVAGPSKTADIEQVLVIGAHGARSLTVFLTR
jgi:L-lactate dehydrogenase complex protein LldG